MAGTRNDNQFLLYIDFNSNDTFTLVGGLKNVNINSEKTPIRTDDFASDFEIYLRTSGIEKMQISGNGIVEPKLPKALFDELVSFNREGEVKKVRLESGGLIGNIEGSFFLSNISFSDSFDLSIEFAITLLSHGKVTYN